MDQSSGLSELENVAGSRDKLPEALKSELLDPASWEPVLEKYAGTTKLAVALVDLDGRLIGTCHNPQPIWLLTHAAASASPPECPFCFAPPRPCSALSEALRTNKLVLAHDASGLAHIAVPLSLDSEVVAILLAGQVFDQYPDQLKLERVARASGVPSTKLWQVASQQRPMSRSTLIAYGDLLATLGQAFLRQRFSTTLERELIDVNRKFRLLVEGVKDYALFMIDPTGRVVSWNIGSERVLGYSEQDILGQNWSIFFTPEDLQNGASEKEMRTAASEGKAEDDRWHIRKDGRRFYASGVLTPLWENGQLHGFAKIMRDITQERNTEEAMRQAQKLESIGLLAGGIAHDFNNLLTIVIGNATLVLTDPFLADNTRKSVEEIVASGKRAADLTSQLLAYAGKGRYVVRRLELGQLITETLTLIRPAVPKKVRLELDLAPDLPSIEADATQIQQILMNLIINAAEAIGEREGTIWLTTGIRGVQTESQSLVPGKYVYAVVKDSGSGMSSETKDRIFDPFFTTKFTGRGLGLAAVQGIIRAHKGSIEVYSRLGEGSTFTVLLPAVERRAPPIERAIPAKTIAGVGTILIADDEPALLGIMEHILKRYGYSVLLANNGREAVELFQSASGEIAAVLLDMVMPVMSGDEAFHQIKQLQPDVPIIATSGYSEVVATERFGSSGVAAFLQKPFTAEKLAEVIQQAIALGKPRK